ncbi:MAG TPA: ribose-phosphate pyrophosphokinase [Cytophagales bacterium]|nr:ribose-phosphate pyrophosphokinase [Cytophagales bacterium]HAA17341.1 ribose-phosphate pyrophosphokinase [Cytophagales bacterium]HAP63137.1 ribose-phosphate pyrophosphokinase [Cytophagales bacterium]
MNYLFCNTSSAQPLADAVAQHLDLDRGVLYSEEFSDGEIFVRFESSIRGNALFLLAQPAMPYANLFEMYLAVDAARRASAQEIICVLPYLPHSRQERKDTVRTSIAARVVADFLQTVGADRVVTVELHTSTIEGFYKIPVDHLHTDNLFIQHIKESNLNNLCLVSPDFGGLKRIRQYKKALDVPLAVIHKERLKPNQVSNMEVIGEVKGADVVIVDDLIDTAGTLCKAADMLMAEGANSVRAYITHGVLSGPAYDRIEASPLEKLYITDTIPLKKQSDKIEIISCAPLIAAAMQRLMTGQSLKALAEPVGVKN